MYTVMRYDVHKFLGVYLLILGRRFGDDRLINFVLKFFISVRDINLNLYLYIKFISLYQLIVHW